MAEAPASAAEALAAAIASARSNTGIAEVPAPIEGFVLRAHRFDNANWSELRFLDCDFSGARLAGAKLTGTQFDKCAFASTDLSEADLVGASFLNSCDLENVNLTKAEATSAEFRGAVLKDARATGAVFVDAEFLDAELEDAHFEGADLRGARNMKLNGTFIQNAQFSHNAPDRWSLLRRTYTGPRFLLNLLFPGIFIASVSAKTYLLWALAMLQGAALGASATDYCNQAGSQCEQLAVWEIVTGWHAGFWTGLFVSTSLLYNALRLFMTLTVAQMRDEEERTGRSPKLRGKVIPWKFVFEPGYDRLASFHRGLQLFQWLTFALAVIGWWELLATDLLVPRWPDA